MTTLLMYPYSYGDEGRGYEITSNDVRFFKIAAFAIIPMFSVASLALAVDSDKLLNHLEECIKQLDGSPKLTRRISPAGATACFISGICANEAKKSLLAGNTPAAAAFVCGAAVMLCIDRVAANKGY